MLNEKEAKKRRFVYRNLDSVIYRELCLWIRSYHKKRKRVDLILEEITGLRERPELFVQGGERQTRFIAAEEALKRAKTRYYTLFQDVEAVEKAIDYLKIEASRLNTSEYGERLSKAVILHCTNRKDYDIPMLKKKFNLSMHENTFLAYKRLFIGNLAERLGYIGLLEIWT